VADFVVNALRMAPDRIIVGDCAIIQERLQQDQTQRARAKCFELTLRQIPRYGSPDALAQRRSSAGSV